MCPTIKQVRVLRTAGLTVGLGGGGGGGGGRGVAVSGCSAVHLVSK